MIHRWVLACALSPGCATLMNGTTQEITLNTTPPGATVVIDGRPDEGRTTPATVVLARRQSHTIRFRKAGYEDLERTVYTRMSGYAFFDGVLGLLPLLFDAAVGSAWDLEPGALDERLVRSVE